MPNKYESYYGWTVGNSITTNSLSWAATGATMGAVGGPLGAGIGAIVGFLGGLIFGGFQGDAQAKQQLNEWSAQARNSRMEATVARNRTIQSAQRMISNTRNSFDSVYGEGMYDEYDELFQTIFNLPAGTQTVSDLLESLKFDTVSGKITSSVYDSMASSSLSDVLSLKDINANYLEYMKQQIHTSDTVLGMQFAYNTEQENMMIDSYFDNIDQYNLQLAQQFNQAFLQRRSELASAEMAMGEASAAQASSGMRQTGTGTNTTNLQKFQNDLADVAYASSINYMLRMYQMQGKRSNADLLADVYAIRYQNEMTTKEALNASIEGYNEAREEQINAAETIKDLEGTIEEYNDQLDEIHKQLGGDHYEELDPEDIIDE